jgi:NodT family efflux transporter outer membrane factor (OMF) lipoprotein
MALLPVGCIGPKFVTPTVALNPKWSVADSAQLVTRATLDSAWWTAFGDPVLDSLVGLAYRQNLPLQVAGLRIMEARARLAMAVGRQFPQTQAVFGNVNAVGLSKNIAEGIGFDRNFWTYLAGFDVAWELDFWGKYRNEVTAQRAGYIASMADYDFALVSLTAEVARTYTMIRTDEVLIAQARQNAQLQEEGLRIADSRFRNGATSELDTTQASTLLESTRRSIPQLEISLIQARNALNTLLGQPTGTVETLLQRSQGIPAAPPQVAVVMPAELLRRRPDVRSAELLAMAQCARTGVAKSELYPQLQLSGLIGTQASSGSGVPSSNLFTPGSFFYLAGPRILWPILNYGQISNNVRVQDARLQQLLIDYRNTVLTAAQEVEDGLTGYLKAREAAVFAQNAADAAQRSVDLAFIQYREGAVDFQRVLDAQRSLLQEQNTLAQARSAIATNLIAVYKDLGGGWELRSGQPFVPDSTRIEMQRRTNWGNLFTMPKAPANADTSITKHW